MKYHKGASQVSRRRFLRAASGLFLPSVRPNIVFILADDLGFGDLGCYNGPIATPNLDQLAQGGMKFTNAHSGGPVCSASRCTLLTGRYAQRLGIPALTSVIFPETKEGLPQGVYTLADLLGYQGYHTACVGKWHLGHNRPEYMPPSHGFRRYRGVPYSNDMSPLPYYRDIEVADTIYDADTGRDQRETLTRRFTADALEFLRQAQNEPDPFFLYLPLTDPHRPLMSEKDFGLGPYYNSVRGMDEAIGHVLAALPANTFVMFASDNGADESENLRSEEKGSNGILRGSKFTLFEGGIRIPMIGFYPGVIPAGLVCSELVSFLDIWPTFGQLAGYASGDSHLGEPDGVDIFRLLSGETVRVERPHVLLYFRSGEPQAAAGRFTDPADGKDCEFKLWFERSGNRLVPSALYDMRADPGEAENVLFRYPAAAAAMLSDAQSQLAGFPGALAGW